MVASSFAILGIGPTTDQKRIRRAYASALKRIDQAADPEGFTALRGAYEHARAWAEHQPEASAAFAGVGDETVEDELPRSPAEQLRSDLFPARTPAAPEATSLDALPDEEQAWARQESASESPSEAPHGEAGEEDLRADPLPRVREDLDEGVAYWTQRLMHTPDDELAQAFDSALADERLVHLEARAVLARSLAMALREQPDGRLALFNIARRIFDWNGLGVPVPGDPALSGWVNRVLEQIERYGHLPLPLRVRLDAVLMLARRLPKPNVAQAGWYAQNFELLLQHAPDLVVLDLGNDRIRAWRDATRRLIRVRDWLLWLSVNRVKLAITAVCLIGGVLMYQDARDGTTYKEAQPTRASLLDGRVTVRAQRVAADPQPCAKRTGLSPPLGCQALTPQQSAQDSWPTATPMVPQITEQPNLFYPQEARVRAIKGKVWVRVMLDSQGQVLHKVVMFPSGSNTLDEAAIDAAGRVRMTPAIQDGSAVPGQAVLVFDYQLEAP